MKQSYEEVKKRRNLLLEYIKEQQSVAVSRLIEVFLVSPATIRRDLDFLDEKKYITRSYGMVAINKYTNSIADDNLESNKNRIAKYVAKQIREFETVLVNTSSTAIQILKFISGIRVTIITNNANAIHIDHDPNIMVLLTGGELRTPKYSMTGDFAISTLNKVRSNKVVMGVSGISVNRGLTANMMQEATINQLMIDRCDGEVYVVCDHSKLGREVAFQSATIDRIDYIITDRMADPAVVAQFEEKGIKVILV